MQRKAASPAYKKPILSGLVAGMLLGGMLLQRKAASPAYKKPILFGRITDMLLGGKTFTKKNGFFRFKKSNGSCRCFFNGAPALLPYRHFYL
ncbi:UNVERIFIED_ORG: hypothetical protein ABRZ91_002299 [Heyndrickxia coagulans]